MRLFRYADDRYLNLDLATDFIPGVNEKTGERFVQVFSAASIEDQFVTTIVEGEDAERLVATLEAIHAKQSNG